VNPTPDFPPERPPFPSDTPPVMQTDSVEPISIPSGVSKLEIPDGLWTKCPRCGEMVYTKALDEKQRVCPHCEHHFPIGAPARIAALVDPGTFEEHDGGLTSVDVLGFSAAKSYADQIVRDRKKTGLNEAVVSGLASIEEQPVSLAVMDFRFLAGSMGSVVGEKITRAIERATALKLPCIVICASGGARMQEGALSLMQMAKTSAALARHAEARLPYLSILTHPTTGGVTASYASLGDLNLAEPHAMIGFAGPRVIKETTKQDLPEGFQTAEFLLDHGLIDRIVHRHQMRAELGRILRFLKN